MREDVLLRQLGRVAREQAAAGEPSLDERWGRLAAGTLSAEEDAELRRLGETSEEARELYEAFRPLGPEFHARVMQALARKKPGPLTAWRATMGAAAAMLAVLLLGPAARLLQPPVPLYAIAEFSGGTRTTRGELDEPSTFQPGDRFQASLRPETAVQHASSLRAKAFPLRARAFLLRGEQLRPLDGQPDIDQTTGAVRISGVLDSDLSPGPWTLWLVVGRRGLLPNPERLRTLPAGAPHSERGWLRDWVAVPATLTIGSNAKE